MEVSDTILYANARKTIYEMLTDRGYEIINKKEKETELELKNIMTFEESIIRGTNGDESISVYFVFDKIGVKDATDIIKFLVNDECKHAMLICKEGYTPCSYKLFNKPVLSVAENKDQPVDIEIEVFLMDNVMYNITKHIYQPKHIKLIKDKATIKKVYKTFNINKAKNININLTDPINKYFNGKSGDMYKVHHQGGRIEYVTVI